MWVIQTTKWVIQTIGEFRSVSEDHKSNLGARISKNHQITDQLHTQCEHKQDHFRLSNHVTCYYKVYNTSENFHEDLESNCEHTSQNFQNGIKPP